MAEVKKFESSLPTLLMQLMGDKKTTTGGTSTTTTSQTGTANTDPLMQVFNQQMSSSTPEGMAAMIASIFEKGATNVPGLTQQYANATGTRVSKNSGLQLALSDLNKTIAQQVSGAVMEQQGKTAQTASAIAQATRGSTTTESKSTPDTVVRTGNPKAAGGLGAAGFALNMADKFGLLNKLKTGLKGASTPMTVTPRPGLDSNSLKAIYGSEGYGSTTPLAGYDIPVAGDAYMPGTVDYANFSGTGSTLDFGSASNYTGFNGDPVSSIDTSYLGDFFGSAGESLAGGYDLYDGYDLGGEADLGSLSDWGAPADLGGFSDVGGSVVDTGGGFLEEFFDGWFADGGLVRASKLRTYADGGLVSKDEKDKPKPKTSTLFSRRNEALEAALEAAVNGKDANNAYQTKLTGQEQVPIKKADGGVIRNKNNMGAPDARYGTGAINMSGERPAGYGSPADPIMPFVPAPTPAAPVNDPLRKAVSSSTGGSLTSGQLQSSPQLLDLLNQQLKGGKGSGGSEERDTGGMGNGMGGTNATGPAGAGMGGTIGGIGLGNIGTSVAIGIGSALGGPLGGLAVSMGLNAMGAPASAQSVAVNGISTAAQNALGVGVGSSTNASGVNATNGMDQMSDSFSAANLGNTAAVGGFGGGVSASEDAASIGAVNGADSMSDNFGGGVGGFGGGFGGGSVGPGGDGSGGSGQGNSDSVGASVGADSVGSADSTGDSGDYADGGSIKGEVNGKGTGISDSIPARLSDGEYVISKDVVDIIGVSFLDSLQDMFHTPAAIQRLQKRK